MTTQLPQRRVWTCEYFRWYSRAAWQYRIVEIADDLILEGYVWRWDTHVWEMQIGVSTRNWKNEAWREFKKTIREHQKFLLPEKQYQGDYKGHDVPRSIELMYGRA